MIIRINNTHILIKKVEETDLKKKFLFVLSMFSVLLGTSCFVNETPKFEDKILVSISLPNSESNNFINVINNIENYLTNEYSMTSHIEIEYTKSNNETKGQVEDIKTLLKNNPDYLIVYPVSYFGFEEIIAYANNLGSKVIIIGSDVRVKQKNHILSIIKADNVEEGALCAQAFNDYYEITSKNYGVLEIQGELGSAITRDRAKGFREKLIEYNNIQILDVSQNNRHRIDSYAHTKEMIDSYGESIHGVFAHNEQVGLGVFDAFLEAEYEQKNIPVILIGNNEDVMRLIIAGKFYASIVTDLNYGIHVATVIETDISNKIVSDIIIESHISYSGMEENYH